MENLSTLQYRYDDLIVSFNQIDALLTLALSIDITEVKPEVALNYLSVVIDITQKARTISDGLFERLSRCIQ